MAKSYLVLKCPAIANSAQATVTARIHTAASASRRCRATRMVWPRKRTRRRHSYWSFLHKLLCAWNLSFCTKKPLKKLRPAYTSAAMDRGNDKPNNEIVTNDVCTLTESPSRNEIHIARQTVIPTRLESPVRVVSTIPAPSFIEPEPLSRGTEHVIVTTGVANIVSLVPSPVSVTSFLAKPVHLPKKMVFACGAESTSLR